MRKTLLALLFCSILGCVATSLPRVSQNFTLEDDERGLWLRSEEEERVLNRSGVVYKDDNLEAYLNEVAKKILPPEIHGSIPLKIVAVKSHFLNAFTFPNGVVYIDTGLLARMDNEAQLATLLAHEMIHATNRHAIRQFRDTKNKTAFLATITAGTSGLAAPLGALGTLAAITGYSREHEAEADREGFKLLVAADYDPGEAPKLFMHLKQEVEEEKIKDSFFFSTHPKLSERLENFEALVRSQGQKEPGGIQNREVFLQKTARLIMDNARLDLKAGRFKIAQRQVEKYLKMKSEAAEAYCLLGEIHRQRGEGGDIEKARQQYQKAVSIDPNYPDSHRGIGLIHYKQGEKTLARKSLELYLSLSPQAIDRAYVEEYIGRCKEGGKE